MRSLQVVFPASMCAMIPMFRTFDSSYVLGMFRVLPEAASRIRRAPPVNSVRFGRPPVPRRRLPVATRAQVRWCPEKGRTLCRCGPEKASGKTASGNS
jgi:hypothetical protein